MSKKLHEMNHEAEVLVARLGEYVDNSAQQASINTQLPIFEETKHRTLKAIDNINQMIKPTFDNLTNQRTKIELMERVYRKLSKPLTSLEQCMFKAMDHHDALKCQKIMLDQLEHSLPTTVAHILREY